MNNNAENTIINITTYIIHREALQQTFVGAVKAVKTEMMWN